MLSYRTPNLPKRTPDSHKEKFQPMHKHDYDRYLGENHRDNTDNIGKLKSYYNGRFLDNSKLIEIEDVHSLLKPDVHLEYPPDSSKKIPKVDNFSL